MSSSFVIFRSAVSFRILRTWAGVRPGLTLRMSATTPVTCGAAIEVPWRLA